MTITDKRATPDDNRMSEEPLGIIISRGKRDEPVPAFSAFVWGPPASELDKVGTEPRAA